MAKFIGYTGTHKMEPREGLNYSTTYVKQTRAQRDQLVQHCKRVLTEIADAIEGNTELHEWATEPLTGFPRKNLPNRSVSDIIADMIAECQGKRSNGMPKDFALAPIERWNKLFGDSEYAVVLERHPEEEHAS
jgi:hypothetical protein